MTGLRKTRALSTALGLNVCVTILNGIVLFAGTNPSLASFAFVRFENTAASFKPPSGASAIALTLIGPCRVNTLLRNTTCSPFEEGLFRQPHFTLASTLQLTANVSTFSDGDGHVDPSDVLRLLPFTVNPVAFIFLLISFLTSLASLLLASLSLVYKPHPTYTLLTFIASTASFISIAISLISSIATAAALNSLIANALTEFSISTTFSVIGPGLIFLSLLLSIPGLWLGWRAVFIVKRDFKSKQTESGGEHGMQTRAPWISVTSLFSRKAWQGSNAVSTASSGSSDVTLAIQIESVSHHARPSQTSEQKHSVGLGIHSPVEYNLAVSNVTTHHSNPLPVDGSENVHRSDVHPIVLPPPPVKSPPIEVILDHNAWIDQAEWLPQQTALPPGASHMPPILLTSPNVQSSLMAPPSARHSFMQVPWAAPPQLDRPVSFIPNLPSYTTNMECTNLVHAYQSNPYLVPAASLSPQQPLTEAPKRTTSPDSIAVPTPQQTPNAAQLLLDHRRSLQTRLTSPPPTPTRVSSPLKVLAVAARTPTPPDSPSSSSDSSTNFSYRKTPEIAKLPDVPSANAASANFDAMSPTSDLSVGSASIYAVGTMQAPVTKHCNSVFLEIVSPTEVLQDVSRVLPSTETSIRQFAHPSHRLSFLMGSLADMQHRPGTVHPFSQVSSLHAASTALKGEERTLTHKKSGMFDDASEDGFDI
ncbi:hypothetical protein BC830DRAFT_1170983 [Chytriomyces sp. MP71]|nr:hypothetical protein BC830DRAFT_1170983 [Chytriomyces sp. MP71]